MTAAAQTIVLKMVLFQRSSIFGTSKKKKKNIKKEKKASKMGEKGLQRIYQMKDLNPECTRIPKKQPNLKISNISKFKEDREISNKDL